MSYKTSDEQEIYDLVIIGGGISASFLCLSIFKINPLFKILIVEQSETFSQKIGESVIDMTAIFVNSLGIDHLLKKHEAKTGVRYLFNESNSKDTSSIVEFASPTFPGLIKGYHLNRRLFDQQLLDEVIQKGGHVFRPAEIKKTNFSDFNNQLEIEVCGKIKNVKSRWLVDASGRSRYIPNKLNWKDKAIELNTGSLMAHFTNIAPSDLWDTPKNEHWDNCSIGLRQYSTTHLMRKNCWWWVIQLDETTTSIGVVFDKNKMKFDNPEKHFLGLISFDAQLSIMTKNAKHGPIRHIENVPFVSEKLYSKGIALIGDSAAFIDPLIGPGLELTAQQSVWLAEMLTKEKKTGKFNEADWKKYSNIFFKAFETRLNIYQTAYNFIESFDIFSTWIKQGNYVYFGWLVYPSILFKKRFKYPLRFNLIERLAFNYFKKRYNKIHNKRVLQNKISITKPNTIVYSGVRVPKDFRFPFIPIHLLFKSLLAYLTLEIKEIKMKRN